MSFRYAALWRFEDMVLRRRYPLNALLNEFDQMVGGMDDRFQSMLGSSTLPARVASSGLIPTIRGECHVDVRDEEDEVIIIADLPGVEKEDMNLRLFDPVTLGISCERKREVEEEDEERGYYMRERAYGSMSRTVNLPSEVTTEGASASFKNGVLEVHLKKVPPEPGTTIPIN